MLLSATTPEHSSAKNRSFQTLKPMQWTCLQAVCDKQQNAAIRCLHAETLLLTPFSQSRTGSRIAGLIGAAEGTSPQNLCNCPGSATGLETKFRRRRIHKDDEVNYRKCIPNIAGAVLSGMRALRPHDFKQGVVVQFRTFLVTSKGRACTHFIATFPTFCGEVVVLLFWFWAVQFLVQG